MKATITGLFVATAIAAASAMAADRHTAAVRAQRGAALLAHVNVTASEYKFVLSAKSAKRGVVVFRVTNVGKEQHNFMIKRRKTKTLSHGQASTVRVTFLSKGTYQYESTVFGDAGKGMTGVFTIK